MIVNSLELEDLIAELMKDQPDQQTVKVLMNKQGIPYTQDPFRQMNQVLQYMNQEDIVRQLKEKESSI